MGCLPIRTPEALGDDLPRRGTRLYYDTRAHRPRRDDARTDRTQRGESIYTKHLEEHGEGLHHVACFAFEDTESVVKQFEEAGMGILQSGNFAGVPYWYFDTREQLNGVIFETATNLESIPEPDETYPE